MKRIIPVLTALMVALPVCVFCQPGNLDTSFSKDGKIKSSLLSGSSALAIQTDSKILVEKGFSVVRFKANGSIDKTFGTDGKASVTFEGYNAGYLMALQTDGKIILGGFSVVSSPKTNSNTYYISLARLTQDGLPDSSFGIDGQVKTHRGIYVPSAIIVSSEGKILVTTYDNSNYSSNIRVVEYNPDGSIFNQFGYNSGDLEPHNFAQAIAIQSNGKIVIAGSTSIESAGSYITLLRFKPNGSLDHHFGTGGKSVFGSGSGYALAIQPDDKIIALAEYGTVTQYPVIARFTKNGFADSSFGTTGIVHTPFRGNAVVLQANGKAVISGSYNSDVALARYKEDGTLDETFGVGGMVTTDFGNNDDGSGVAVQTDGRIVMSGTSFSKNDKCILARYLGDEVLFANANNARASQVVASAIRIYPNPVRSTLNIFFDKTNMAQRKISIYDVSGQLRVSASASHTLALNILSLTTGIYFVKITDESGKLLFSSPMIKQ